MIDTNQHREPSRSQAGFSLAELSVILGVIGVLFALSLPTFISYYQTARVRGAAAEIATLVNQGRQLGHSAESKHLCAHQAGSGALPSQQHLHGARTGSARVPTANGDIPAPDGIDLTTTADPVFTYLGAAAPAGDRHRLRRQPQSERHRLGVGPRDRRALSGPMLVNFRLHSASAALHWQLGSELTSRTLSQDACRGPGSRRGGGHRPLRARLGHSRCGHRRERRRQAFHRHLPRHRAPRRSPHRIVERGTARGSTRRVRCASVPSPERQHDDLRRRGGAAGSIRRL